MYAVRHKPSGHLLPIFFLLSGCALSDPLDSAFGPDGRTIREAIAGFPEEKRDAFSLAEVRCTRCHSLDRPFAAHVPAGAWRASVRKMTAKPGAGITEEEAGTIADFFEYFSTRQREAGRATPERRH